MAPTSKLVRLGVDGLAMELRAYPEMSERQILEAINERLAQRHAEEEWDGDPERVSLSTLQRFYASVGQAAAPALHRPEVVEAHQALAIDVAGQLHSINEVITRWVDEVDVAVKEVWPNGHDGPVAYLADWPGRALIMREYARHLQQVTTLMERIYSAQHIAAFQREVLATINRVNPQEAARIVEALSASRGAVESALLGARPRE